MKKIAIFSVFIIGLSLYVDKNVAGPIDLNLEDLALDLEPEDLNFALDSLQYFIKAFEYYMKNADRIDQEYHDFMNNGHHVQKRLIPEIYTGIIDKIKSFLGFKKPGPNLDKEVQPKKPGNKYHQGDD